MDRKSSWFWLCGVWQLAAAVMISAGGCKPLAIGLYILKGQSVPAKYNDLNGKRVAIVCRPVTTLQYRNSSVARDLARQVGALAKEHVPKIKVIEQREVAEWTDENNWDNYVEVGKALNADIVLGIELEDFSLSQDRNLLQGKANVTVLVYDVKKGKEPVHEEHVPQVIYPPSTPISDQDQPEAQFRRKFIDVLSERIARNFYEHDPTADVANDSTALY